MILNFFLTLLFFCFTITANAQTIPTLSATFTPLPIGVTSNNPQTIVAGTKTAFIISASTIPSSSRNFDDSILLTDSTGQTFTIPTEIASTEIDFPFNPAINFIFDTETIPLNIANGNGSISLKSKGIIIAKINVNITHSDILNTDSEKNPALNRFKLRRNKARLTLFIRGRNLENKEVTSFSTIPASSLKQVKIRTNKKGFSRMVARFTIPDKNLSRVIFTISTPTGQVIRKIKLREPAFRKEKI